jgi:aminoglycoside/choline kinase family phosphotransferase
VLRTDHGLLWNDFEDVCAGPVEWDVAGLVASARASGQSEAFVEELLDAYGGPDLDALGDFLAAHEFYTSIWRSYDAQRRRHAAK